MNIDPTPEQIEGALGYIDKTIDNCQDLPADLAWANSEVLEMLAQVRAELMAAAGAAPQEPPVYLALDVWQALGFPVGEFDGYYERNGWADTWANLLHAPGGVDQRSACGVDVGGEPCVLRSGHGLGPHMGASDVGSGEPLPLSEYFEVVGSE